MEQTKKPRLSSANAMEKMTSTGTELTPELVHHIATYVKSLKNVLTFLRAFPERWLSEPLKSILLLNQANEENHLNISFWPRLVVETAIQDQDAWKLLMQAIIVIPAVSVHGARVVPLAPATKIDLVCTKIMNDIDFAVEKWNDRIVAIQLSSINLSHCECTRLCEVIMTFPVLRKVGIGSKSGMTLSNTQQKDLFQALSMSSVTDLDYSLKYQSPEWDSDVANTFVSWISTKPVTRMHLTDISFSENCGKMVLDAIFSSSTLRDIGICRVLQPRYVASPWPLPSNLKTLNVREHCQLLDCIKPTIAEVQLTELVLSHHRAAEDNSYVSTYQFYTDTLPSLRCIRTLKITGELYEEECRGIVLILPQLVKLKLRCNHLEDEYAKIIIETLPQCKFLNNLSLFKQNLSHVSAVSLAKAIPYCKTLKKLDLSFNNIGSIGAYALSSVLKYLDVANFHSNYIGFDGAVAISHVLHETEHMKKLDLSYNLLGSGAWLIIKKLGKSKQRKGVVDITDTLPSDYCYEETEYCEGISKLPEKTWCIFKCENDMSDCEPYPLSHSLLGGLVKKTW